MDDIRSRMESPVHEAHEDPQERDRIFCFKCGEEFLVKHVTDSTGWVCPACAHPNLNLHRHFVALAVIFAALAALGLALTVLYALTTRQDTAFLYLMWSCMHTTASGYAVMAIFSDKRAYGLRTLRTLLPALFVSAMAASIVYWFPFRLLTLIIAAPAFGAIGAYGAYVFRHTLRMAEAHKPRETVVRPMYTLISVTVHVLLLLYLGLAAYIIHPPGGGTTFDTRFYDPNKPVVDAPQLPDPTDDLDLQPEPTPETTKPDTEIRPIIPIRPDPTLPKIIEPSKREPRPARPERRPRPNALRNRFNRAKILSEHKAPPETEVVTLQALRWLKRHQNEDGSWGEPPIQPAMTGLALLCFLGHGEDHQSFEFGAAVRGAIDWLVGNQDEDGFFAHQYRWAYQHGIATYAMAEAYAMTGLLDLKPLVFKAARRICEGQTPEGGWYYGYAKVADDGSPKRGGDTSVCGWQVQALTAASGARIQFSNNMLQEALVRAAADLKSRFSPQSGFGYTGTGPSRSEAQNYCTTAIGTLCLEFLGKHASPEVRGGLDLMRRYSCDWGKTDGGAFGPLYGWYYTTQAMWHATADPKKSAYWKYWNPLFSKMLVRCQHNDGHWDYPDTDGGRRESRHFGGKNRLVYSTAMCCLMLEVYYRYLPTYRALH